MSQLAPLAVAVPLLGAALLILCQRLLPRSAPELLAVGIALATTGMTTLLLVHVGHGLTVYWFGGWHPRQGVAIGIDFSVSAIGVGLAAFVSLLMVLALIYGLRHLDVQHPYYHVLMLTFMAGMVGFCLTGDLFNMFVMFEVMSVSAVALVGYKIGEGAALEGGLNFAVINTIGAFLFLLGIALIYAHTGALNLAQMGASLRHGGDDRVVVIAFTLIVGALLIKAAVVPFHFWLADAYAVALTPVCLLLAGAMSELGIYGIGQVWFTAFQGALGPHADVVRAIFVGAGLLTALWGGAMALTEDHLKRLLAFVTISFVGVFLIGMGLLSQAGVAGTAVYVLADGFGKALLFACVGIVQHRLGKVGQHRLHGRARSLAATGVLFAAGGVLITSMPPFGPFLGKSMIDDAAIKAGYGFVPPLVALASALCGAAVLRAGARVFCGWGEVSRDAPDLADEDTGPETRGSHARTPATMFIPAVLLLAGAVATGVWSGLPGLAATAAHRFTDFTGYYAAVFGTARHLGSVGSSSPEWFDYLYGAAATGLAIVLAGLELWGERVVPGWRPARAAGAAAIRPVRSLHSGRVGDYTAALALGIGVFGALLAATLA
ncbi:MAG TPA: proton-conducting transporter membrane subunit [Solirubrobacteraceae bacterium]|nr:proton-conducting transporter membrane subunit [Solirubrobacteraceae bacterium]